MSEYTLAMIGRCTVWAVAILVALAICMVPFLMHWIEEEEKEIKRLSGRIDGLWEKLDKLDDRVGELEER